jgi:hypothetical protein
MPARSEDIERLAIAHEDGALILANDQLGTEPEFARATFWYAANDFIRVLVGKLDQIDDRH